MVWLIVYVNEVEWRKSTKEWTENGRMASKAFHWPVVPSTGDSIHLLKGPGGIFAVKVTNTTHFMDDPHSPRALVMCTTLDQVSILVKAGWERHGNRQRNFDLEVPVESLKYNSDSPAPDEESANILAMSNRIREIFNTVDIKTVGQITSMTFKDFTGIPGLGYSSFYQIRHALRRVGRSFR